ncbi:MAG: serine/threonine protein kinase [Acidobacteria bacterium]|nr:serine/threonine protein kinase [Acidobacteriota bacterium]
MQYAAGEPLSHLLKDKKALKLETAMTISMDILNAIGAIHQKGIIHRDIKPSNIIIEKETGKAIIIDFGLAKDVQKGSNQTFSGMQMGTYSYMSPEQYKDSGKVGPATDIYSFGVILYEMLTGKPPYEGSEAELMHNHIYGEIPDIKKVNKDVPDIINKLIRKAMAREVGDRGNAQYYKEKIEALLETSKTVAVKKEK